MIILKDGVLNTVLFVCCNSEYVKGNCKAENTCFGVAEHWYICKRRHNKSPCENDYFMSKVRCVGRFMSAKCVFNMYIFGFEC